MEHSNAASSGSRLRRSFLVWVSQSVRDRRSAEGRQICGWTGRDGRTPARQDSDQDATG
jgi:hypothetical protein